MRELGLFVVTVSVAVVMLIGATKGLDVVNQHFGVRNEQQIVVPERAKAE